MATRAKHVTEAQHDRMVGALARVPKQLAKHVTSLEALGSEAGRGEVRDMLKMKQLYLWWD